VTSSALYLNHRAFDDPWRRLPLTLAAAMLISAALLCEFGRIMNRPETLPEPKPIEAQIIELPPPETPPPPKPEPVKISKPVAPSKPQPVPEKPQLAARTETTAAPVPLQEQLPPQVQTPPASPLPGPAPTSRNSTGDSGNMGAQAIDRPLPKIPDDLREQAFSVAAIARFRIAVDGTATVELATPTPNPRLNRLLLDTLRNWKFFPAMKDGKPIASVQEIRVQFEVK
jgi:protein TonB